MRGNEVDESSGEKFEDQHCYMFSAAGLLWPPDYKTLPADLHDRIDYLSRRQKECAYYHSQITQKLVDESGEMAFYDGNMNPEW